MAVNSIIFIGVKRGSLVAKTDGRSDRSLNKVFTKLTPKLFARIPDHVLPGELKNFVTLMEESVVRVDGMLLGTALRDLNLETHVIEACVGGEFRTLTPELTQFADLVPLIRQVKEIKGESGGRSVSTNPDNPVLHGYFHCSPEVADGRRVEAWLDGIDHPAYENELGMFIRVKRFAGSLLDHITVWVPLGLEVVDIKRA